MGPNQTDNCIVVMWASQKGLLLKAVITVSEAAVKVPCSSYFVVVSVCICQIKALKSLSALVFVLNAAQC